MLESRDKLKARATDFCDAIKRGLDHGRTVYCPDEDQIWMGFRTTPRARVEEKDRLSLPTRWGVVVGLDLREWTKRSVPGQMLMASIMNARINQAYTLLKLAGFLTVDDPLFNVPTGDGAFIAFDAGKDVSKEERAISDARRTKDQNDSKPPPPQERVEPARQQQEVESAHSRREEEREMHTEPQHSEQDDPGQSEEQSPEEKVASAHSQRRDAIGKAISFVLVLNTLFAEQNVRRPIIPMEPDGSGALSILPIYPRFCLVLDKMLLCIDVRGQLNAIGPATCTCGRILSTDHGNHFLVHDKLLHECDRHGGFARVIRHAGLGDWKPRFHLAELPEQKVKSGQFRFADVFGHYSDEPMLRLRQSKHIPPVEYHIGTHDVLRLDNGG